MSFHEFADELSGALNKADGESARTTAKNRLLAAGNLMGLLQLNPEEWFKWTPEHDEDGLSGPQIEVMIEQRRVARADKNFSLSDKIRNDLASQGIVLEDGGNGTAWKRS